MEASLAIPVQAGKKSLNDSRPSMASVAIEAPQNGIAGLKHWRHDIVSGLMVAMISLPFSMGIAITSGAPPVCGIMSAIIAGFLLPFLGGSFVTISGPAAGLAPAIYSGIVMLCTLCVGELLLKFFGISVSALRIAGGLVAAQRGWELLFEPENQDER